MKAAHVPEKTTFATKPTLAIAMIGARHRRFCARAWVAADSVYGVGVVEGTLRHTGKGYVLGVASDTQHGLLGQGQSPSRPAAESIARGLAASDSKRLSAGNGVKGQRLYGLGLYRTRESRRHEYNASRSGLWTRGLLIRRTIAARDLASFSTSAPARTWIDDSVRVEGSRFGP